MIATLSLLEENCLCVNMKATYFHQILNFLVTLFIVFDWLTNSHLIIENIFVFLVSALKPTDKIKCVRPNDSLPVFRSLSEYKIIRWNWNTHLN